MGDVMVLTPFGWVSRALVKEYWAANDAHEAAQEASQEAWAACCEANKAGDWEAHEVLGGVYRMLSAVEAVAFDRVLEAVGRVEYHAVPQVGESR